MYISAHAFTVKSVMASIYGPLPPENGGKGWRPPALSDSEPRYLWTDAFGVVNFISLYKIEDDPAWLECARALIGAVHEELGRTRDRSRRLRGADDEHPLGGGLRIGKKDEHGPDGDGQYHHYLTLWMFALNRFSLAANEPRYNELAIELAKAVHPRFVYERESPRPKMYWKISMDLDDGPLVRSEGNLDPINGYVIYKLLARSSSSSKSSLSDEISDYWKIVESKYKDYTSSDTLDLGMTLWTCHWLTGGGADDEEKWALELSHKAFDDLSLLQRSRYFASSQEERLAFRDFGTALGLRCYDYTSSSAIWEALADHITDSWNREDDLEDTTPPDLRAITMVMYAAGLEAGAFKKGFF